MAMNLNELTLDSIGDLPLFVKWIVIAVLCAGILFGGFWFLNKPQLEELDKKKQEIVGMKEEFELKQREAASLESYKKQMVEIKKTFGVLLRKLPSKTEVPALLEDISNAGISSGLRFTSFKPQAENVFSFYAELPVELSVVGDYHQLAEFVSKISSLDRIVMVRDFTISKGGDDKGGAAKGSPSQQATANKVKRAEGDAGVGAKPGSNKVDESSLLSMKMIIMTYRYREDSDEGEDLGGKDTKPAAGAKK